MAVLAVTSHGRRGEGALWGVFHKGTHPSWPYHLSNAPPTNTIALGVGFQHKNFGGGGTNIQSLAMYIRVLKIITILDSFFIQLKNYTVGRCLEMPFNVVFHPSGSWKKLWVCCSYTERRTPFISPGHSSFLRIPIWHLWTESTKYLSVCFFWCLVSMWPMLGSEHISSNQWSSPQQLVRKYPNSLPLCWDNTEEYSVLSFRGP